MAVKQHIVMVGLNDAIQRVELTGTRANQKVKAAIHKAGSECQKEAKEWLDIYVYSTPESPSYKRTGNLKRSVLWTLLDGGWTAIVISSMKYSAHVEYGTRSMSPRPYMRSAYDIVKHHFKQNIKRIVSEL